MHRLWQEQLPDFAIISLKQEDYGTDVFAFLPLEQRDLTKEELCSLAAAFHGVDAETILQDRYSYKSGSKESRNIDSNRPLTVRENFMERISVLEQYLTKGRRAKGTAAAYPLTFLNDVGETVWIYPEKSMDEEQMLYLLDRRYGDMPEETYTPKEGQLEEKAVRKQAKKLLKEFVTEKTASKTYVIYTNGSMGGRQTQDYWTAYMHLEDEKNDFYLRISADSGELLEWKRLPNDFYTDEGYDANNMQNVVSDEQLLEVAKEYIQGYLHMEQVEYVIDASDEETAKVTAGTGRQVFKLTIDKNILQVSGLEIEQ